MTGILKGLQSRAWVWLILTITVTVCFFILRAEETERSGGAASVSEEEKSTTFEKAPLQISTESGNDQIPSRSVFRKPSSVSTPKHLGREVCKDCGKDHGSEHGSLSQHLSRSTEGLVEINIEGGGTAIDLNGRFHHASSAHISDSGDVVVHCSTSLSEVLHGPETLDDDVATSHNLPTLTK